MKRAALVSFVLAALSLSFAQAAPGQKVKLARKTKKGDRIGEMVRETSTVRPSLHRRAVPNCPTVSPRAMQASILAISPGRSCGMSMLTGFPMTSPAE